VSTNVFHIRANVSGVDTQPFVLGEQPAPHPPGRVSAAAAASLVLADHPLTHRGHGVVGQVDDVEAVSGVGRRNTSPYPKGAIMTTTTTAAGTTTEDFDSRRITTESARE